MTSAASGWPNHAGGDKVSKAVVWRIEWREFGDGATTICDDHYFTSLYAIEVLAQAILEVAYSDLQP